MRIDNRKKTILLAAVFFIFAITALLGLAISRNNIGRDLQDFETGRQRGNTDDGILEGPGQKSEKISYYISPSGNDGNDGKTEDSPFKTIQKAIDIAAAGDIIHLSDGIYMQDMVTKKDGTRDNPITITGSQSAIVKGGGNARILEINHDNIILENFTIDGLHGKGKDGSDYRDKLIYVQGKEKKAGVTGLKIRKMKIKNAGGECIRLRYFAQKNEISENVIENCGIHDFIFDAGGKNGEGIYVGTAPEQTKDGKNPTSSADKSDENWIHNNNINTQGNECVDIKEGSSGNIVENNSCTGQKDKESAGLDSRGNGNIFRNNNVFDNMGAGIRLGGDTEKDGIKNDVYSNTLRNNAGGGIKAMRWPQKKICSNEMIGNGEGDFTGDYAKDLKNETCT